jgi:phosphatidylglycerol:prolipoprotein diacylglycerol transferase
MADWGKVTTLPIGMTYPHAVVGWDYPPGVRVHPTPIYEMVAYLGIFLLLWSRRSRATPDGSGFALLT